MRTRGYTLIEVILASALTMVVLGILFQLWSYSRFISSSAHQGYVLTEDVGTSFRTLQRELNETSLTSIYLDDQSRLGFYSARDAQGKLQIGNDGAPSWRKMIRYSLRPSADDPQVGQLVREERELAATAPLFPRPAYWNEPPAASARTMAMGLLSRGYDLLPDPKAGGMITVKATENAERGFVVRFVRQEETEKLSRVNPCWGRQETSQADWTKGSTGLVHVTMGVLERDSSTGQIGFVELRMHVRPAHD